MECSIQQSSGHDKLWDKFVSHQVQVGDQDLTARSGLGRAGAHADAVVFIHRRIDDKRVYGQQLPHLERFEKQPAGTPLPRFTGVDAHRLRGLRSGLALMTPRQVVLRAGLAGCPLRAGERHDLPPASGIRPLHLEYLEDFVAAVRNRTRPAADVEEGHLSTLLAHLANISFRVGNRQLEFDPESETFTHSDEANRYLGRAYREPWVLPSVA